MRATALLPAVDDTQARIAAVRAAARRTISPALLEVIREQQSALPPPHGAARGRSLEALAAGGAAAVVTGQQVGLFGGPLFSLYKAASAIAAARALEQASGVPTVPIFWLQTEDHDFPEIDHCFVPQPATGAPLRLSISGEPLHARVAVAQRRLGPDVTERLAELEQALGPAPHAAEMLELLRATYSPGRSLAHAFSSLMAAMWSDTGLLFFDPRGAGHPRVAELLAPVYTRAVEEHLSISAALTTRCDALRAAGFDEQVHVRPGSPLVFLHAPDAAGPRFRLDLTGPQSYILVGDEEQRAVTHDELRHVARHVPARLSTSALLRPIAQDTLLPTAAYVGGPGEIAYLAQAAPLYPIFDLPPPLAIHRARFRCCDARTRQLLDEVGLPIADTARPRDALLTGIAARHADPSLPPPEALRDRLGAGPLGELAALAPVAGALDPRLARATARTRATIERAFDRFTAKYARALRERDQVAAARLDRALALLQPGGEPQERVYSLPWFAARFGVRAFVGAVLAAAVPFDGTLRDLSS